MDAVNWQDGTRAPEIKLSADVGAVHLYVFESAGDFCWHAWRKGSGPEAQVNGREHDVEIAKARALACVPAVNALYELATAPIAPPTELHQAHADLLNGARA